MMLYMKVIMISYKDGFVFLINIWCNSLCVFIILYFMDKKVYWSLIKLYNVLKCWCSFKFVVNDYIYKIGICFGFLFFINNKKDYGYIY